MPPTLFQIIYQYMFTQTLHMFIHVSQRTQMFHKPILILKVLIQITRAHFHVHGTIQLYAHSFRNCLAHPVCTANQPLLQMKGYILLWPFPILRMVSSLERFPLPWSPVAPAPSPDAVAVSLPLQTLLAHQLPHSFCDLRVAQAHHW